MRANQQKETHPRYIDGRAHNNKCIDCGIGISYGNNRCRPCFINTLKTKYSGSGNPAWKGGKEDAYKRMMNDPIRREKRLNYVKALFHKKKNNPQFKIKRRISEIIRRRLRKRLANKNRIPTFSVLPYTIFDLMNHLEKQFVEGMSWKNYGEWEIDHIIPDRAFNYTSMLDKDFLKCWELSNLRPIWKKDNCSKTDKFVLNGKIVQARKRPLQLALAI